MSASMLGEGEGEGEEAEGRNEEENNIMDAAGEGGEEDHAEGGEAEDTAANGNDERVMVAPLQVAVPLALTSRNFLNDLDFRTSNIFGLDKDQENARIQGIIGIFSVANSQFTNFISILLNMLSVGKTFG
jgi:hypothetical protein